MKRYSHGTIRLLVARLAGWVMLASIVLEMFNTPVRLTLPIMAAGALAYIVTAYQSPVWQGLITISLLLAAFMWRLPLPDRLPGLVRLGIIILAWSTLWLALVAATSHLASWRKAVDPK